MGNILTFLFAIVILFIAGYDGSSCMLDNCVSVPLVLFIFFWASIFSGFLLFNPVTLAVIGSPYLITFFYENIKQNKKIIKKIK